MTSLPDPLVVLAGRPDPLGATLVDGGVNLAVLVGDEVTRVELCLFTDPGHPTESARVDLHGRTGDVAHGFVPGLGAGQAYGFRVHGPWDPARGLRHNPAKLLVDPWARALGGALVWDDAVHGHDVAGDDDLLRNDADSAPFVPRSLVVDPAFDWGDDRPPAVPRELTVLYEAQVGLFTARHPALPPELRGTYAGLAAPPVIEHLRSLGVTALELLPVHQRVSERHLAERGLSNAWGYNTLGFFAPDPRFARDRSGLSGGQVREFQAMVKALHAAGIEVILDVVYNHTCEGDHRGPTLCWRGLDPLGWYHHGEDPRFLADHTGCGNTLRTLAGPGRRLLFESLRYWIEVMHVDGFRFDLAPALARPDTAVAPDGSLFHDLHDDPVIGTVKLIAEPWDATDAYMLGGFPPGWAEWNGHFRDDVRRFWRGDADLLSALARRLAGSAGVFPEGPVRSINFVTCHDGSTLRDLTTYEQKHNEDNGEDNRDGSDHEYGCHWGVEGETDDPAIVALRGRVARSMMATLRLAAGVPMLLMGDELGRTQAGNNNAYCQEGPAFAVDWTPDAAGRARLAFARRLATLVAQLPALHRSTPFDEQALGWVTSDGEAPTDAQWHEPGRHVMGMHVYPSGPGGTELLVWVNGGPDPVPCRAPHDGPWERVLDTGEPEAPPTRLPAGEPVLTVLDRALVVLRRAGEDGGP